MASAEFLERSYLRVRDLEQEKVLEKWGTELEHQVRRPAVGITLMEPPRKPVDVGTVPSDHYEAE